MNKKKFQGLLTGTCYKSPSLKCYMSMMYMSMSYVYELYNENAFAPNHAC